MPHIFLNHTSYLSQSNLIFVSSIPHICLNHASYLSQAYLIFVSIMSHICLNHTSYLSQSCSPGEAIHIESKSYLFLWTNWYFGKCVHLSEIYGKFSEKNSSQFYALFVWIKRINMRYVPLFPFTVSPLFPCFYHPHHDFFWTRSHQFIENLTVHDVMMLEHKKLLWNQVQYFIHCLKSINCCLNCFKIKLNISYGFLFKV